MTDTPETPATGAADPKPPVDGEPSPEQLCMHCASPLPKGAEFCTKCELFQRRIFTAKSSIGYYTLLNAAVATFVLAATFLVEKMPEWDSIADSDPVIAGTTCFLDRAFISVTNRGHRIAAVVGGDVTADGLKEEDAVKSRQLLLDPKQSFVPAQSSGVLEMQFLDPDTKKLYPFLEPRASCHYNFHIVFQDFKKAEKRVVVPDPCECGAIEYKSLSGEMPAEQNSTSSEGREGK